MEEEGGGSEKCAVRERAIESSLGIPSPRITSEEF